MSWSWKIGRVAGIPIYVHWTFLILIAWILWVQFQQFHEILPALEGVAFVLALFGCVVLHELGHAVTAQRFGIQTTDITLLPIGGVARLQRIPERPWQELLVALAGPAVNVVIVLALLSAGVRLPADANNPRHLVGEQFWPGLLFVNLMLCAFNLLPAFPMDGGRVLRALLAMRMDYARATRLAASVGQIMAIGFALLGLSGNPFLLLIALFVWIGAESEAAMVEERVVLKDVPVRAGMLTEFHTLSPFDTLGHAADVLLAGTQHDFPVMADDQKFTGVLTRSDLVGGLSQAGRDARVADFVKTELVSVDADSLLVPAVAKLREGGSPCLMVVEDGQGVGLLTLENIGEYLMVRSALGSAPREGAELARTLE